VNRNFSLYVVLRVNQHVAPVTASLCQFYLFTVSAPSKGKANGKGERKKDAHASTYILLSM